ncbi:endospore germination permease [Peribacillus sp. SCS-155]|uniref:GerAB/ArcD/ProY family transporter n=1 Tax=Peribacillus sedimenti TaxID=3115297 RepID=UPI003905F910
MERVSRLQIVMLGATHLISATLVSVPAQAAQYARQQVYLSLIIAAIIIVLSLWLLDRVMRRFPKQDLFKSLMVNAGGKGIAVLYVCFFFFILVRDFRMLGDFVKISLLPDTPPIVIGVLLVFVFWYMTRGGAEALGRMAELYLPLLIVAVLFIPLIMVKDFDPVLMAPYLPIEPIGVLKGAWFFVGYIGEVIAMVFVFSNSSYRFRYGLYSLLLGTGVLFILVVSSQLILGTVLLPRMFYPTYELVRHINVTDFLDRFDLPLVGVYLPVMFIKISFSLYIVCLGIVRLLPDASGKLLVTPVSALGFVCAFWFFRDAIQLFNFNRSYPLIALFFELLIPILLFFLLRPKEKVNSEQPNSSA